MSAERRYAILIGSSEFPPGSGLQRLVCPPNDVEDIAELITSAETGLFAKEDVSKLVNRPHYEIAQQINVRARRSSADDVIFIYYSGHGKADAAGRLYLASADTSVDTLEATSVPLDQLRTILESCTSRKIIIVLDCCFSGAAGAAFLRSSADDQMKRFVGARGIYLLTASTQHETAQEKVGERNGVFTKHLIAGVKSGRADTDGDGFITMDELFGYVYANVPREVPQEPERYFLGARGDIPFAKSGKVAAEAHPSEVPAERYRRIGPLRTEAAWYTRPANGACVSLATSPMGRFCAAGFEDGSVRLLRVATGEQVLQQQGDNRGAIWSVTFSPSGDHVAWVNGGSQVMLCDLRSNDLDSITVPNASRLTELDFVGTSMELACAGRGALHLVNLRDRNVKDHPLLGGSITGMACDRANNLVCVGASPGQLSLFDTTTEIFDFDMELDWSRPSAMRFLPSGSAVACGSPDGKVRILDLASRATMIEFGTFSGAVSGLAFSGDGSMLYAADGTSAISVRDAASWQTLATVRLPVPVSTLCAVPTTGDMIVGCLDGSIHHLRMLRGVMTKAMLS